MADVLADPRVSACLVVSMCDRDLYSGALQIDPNNPNKLANGSAKTTNGLLATKAAIQFTATASRRRSSSCRVAAPVRSARTRSPGRSSSRVSRRPGSSPTPSSSTRSGRRPCSPGRAVRTVEPSITNITEIKARVHPDIADIANATDKLVARAGSPCRSRRSGATGIHGVAGRPRWSARCATARPSRSAVPTA